MNEKLMSGYLAFTTEEEFGAAATAEAPATITPTTITIFFRC